MITLEILLVFIAIGFILYSLYREVFGASFTFLVAILFLGVFGVLTPHEILEGFANEQVAIVIMLLLLGDVIKRTGIVENVFDTLFRRAKGYTGFLSRMMIIVAGFSTFLNNTPLVAVMMPYVDNWCKRNNYSVSKFLIPLSYAAILGGSITLIGTSTNLIVNGLLADQEIIDLHELQMFDFAWVGVPMFVIGFFYILFFGNKLLPGKRKSEGSNESRGRQYIVETKIRESSSIVGKTIQSAQLQTLKGLKLVEIHREGEILQPKEELVLDQKDRLFFSGDNECFADLLNTYKSLIVPEVGMLYKIKEPEVTEIIVSQNSALIGRVLKSINFRARYDCAVLAIHRNGEQIKSDKDNIVLRAGDVLLIYAGEAFDNRTRNSNEFYFLSRLRDHVKVEKWKIILLLLSTLGAISLSALHVKGGLFLGLLVVLMMSLLFRITTPKELPKGIDYDLGLIIVMSLALGTAMIKTNAAGLISDMLISLFLPLGNIGVLFGTYLITTLLAAYITNKASVGIIFPIAITIASNLSLDPRPFVLTVAYAAAANFMTPIGYQTNLMVYGPGKYSFKDFLRIGAPLTILYMITTIFILSYLYF